MTIDALTLLAALVPIASLLPALLFRSGGSAKLAFRPRVASVRRAARPALAA